MREEEGVTRRRGGRGEEGENSGAVVKTGWQTKTLGEICEIERGGSPRPIDSYLTDDPNGINWIKIGDTKNVTKYITSTEQKIRPEGAKRSRLVYPGDFILSNSMSFGRPYIMKTTGCIHDGWLVLRQPQVDPDYLFLVLGSDLIFSQFDRLAAGSTVRNLNIGLVQGVQIPIPPLPEQQRIVAILDEAFDGIATAKASAEKNLQNAREVFVNYLQSVFTNGGDSWDERPVGYLCRLINGKAYKRDELLDVGKYPVLRVGNFFTNDHWYHSDLELEPDKYCDKGDLLYAWSASFGPRIWEGGKVIYHYHIWKVIPNPTVVTKGFLKYLLEWDVDQIKLAHGTGTTMMHVGKGSMESRMVPVAPLAKQEGIVARLDDLRDEAQSLESIYRQKLAALDELKQSLLHRAFNGDL